MPTGYRRSPSEKFCAICGDAGATYNYGVFTCKSCKSFFVRCATRMYPHECPRDGKCKIIACSTVNCKGCRYNKCVAVGMSIEDVGNIYKSKINAVKKFERHYAMVERHVGPMLSLGFNFVQQVTNGNGAKWLASFFTNLSKLVLTKDCFGPQLKYFNMKVSLADAFINSNAVFCKDEELAISREEGLRLVIAQNYCRIIMKLIQNNCLPVYHLQFFLWLHYETNPQETLAYIKKGVKKVSKTHAYRVKIAFDFYENYVAPLIEEENVSIEEMNLLLTILLFSPFCDCSDHGGELIRKARGKYINILVEYQNEMYPEMSSIQKYSRLRKMLQFLAKEKEFISMIQQSFTASILNNDDALMGTLTYDVHLRVYN